MSSTAVSPKPLLAAMATDLHTPGEPPKELDPSDGGPKHAPLDAKPVSETEKKSLRAARFGTPLNLSEHEKRQTRAQRFGIGPAVHKTDDSKDSEEKKRRKRAERFGLPARSAANDEERKKARLERFSQGTKTDPLEEEKRKARAMRFAQIPTSEETHENVEARNARVKTDAGKDVAVV